MQLLRSAALLAAVLAVAACGDDGGPTEVDELFFDCDVTAALDPGDDATGSLDAGDCVISDGSYIDVYRLDIGSSRSVRITMTSQDVDSYLLLFDRQGNTLYANDDADDFTFDAEIVTGTLASGRYYIGANSYSPGETGTYRLSVR